MIAQQNIQLLDLLLGSQTASGNAKSQPLQEGQSSVPFMDILGLFVNMEQKASKEGIAEEAGGKLIESQFSEGMFDFNMSLANDLAGGTVVPEHSEASQKNNSVSVLEKSELPFGRYSTAEAIKVQELIDVAQVKQTTSHKNNPEAVLEKSEHLMSRYSAVDAIKIQQLIHGVQAEPTTGKYKILDSKLANGRFELIIAPLSNETGTEIVKVTLPAKMLLMRKDEEITANTNGAIKDQRVSLMSRNDNRLEELFQKLNLKEIEINFEQSEKTTRSARHSDTALIRLIGGDDRTAIATALLPKKEIKLTRQPESGLMRANSISVQPEQAYKGMESDYSGQSRNLVSSLVRNNFVQTARGFDLLNLPSQNNPQGLDPVTDFSLSADARNSLETALDVKPFSGGKTIYSSVRLSLPQTELAGMKSNGRSVTLRIEPEHLGPARLSLTMINNTLTARVTVQTIQARTVIEYSLDQLSDQLNRAGIKVESIEVNVAGGNAQEQLPDRRPVWRRSSKQQTLTLRNEEDIKQVAPIAPSQMIGRQGYIIGDSLNLLA